MSEKLTPVETELSDMEAEALAAVTLPISGWGTKTAKLGDQTMVVIPIEMLDEEGTPIYIQPFLAAENAVQFANTILEAVNNLEKEQ